MEGHYFRAVDGVLVILSVLVGTEQCNHVADVALGNNVASAGTWYSLGSSMLLWSRFLAAAGESQNLCLTGLFYGDVEELATLRGNCVIGCYWVFGIHQHREWKTIKSRKCFIKF